MTIFDQYADLQQYKRVHHTQRSFQEITVTVYKGNGSFNLTEHAYIALGCPTHALLYYSQQEHVCVIQRAAQSDRGAMKIRPRERTNKHYFQAKQFCEMVGITLERKHVYEAELKSGALVIHLGNEIEEQP